MVPRSDRALRILLYFLCLDATVKGLFLLLGGKSLMLRTAPFLPESEISSLLLIMRKDWGALDLGLAVMLFFAARDPVRNLAILYGLVGALCLAAFASLLSLYTLGAGQFYPASWIWGHSLARLVVAGLLYQWRPREANSARPL